jgi:hypothetical protein
VLISGVNTIPIPLVKLAQLAAAHSTQKKSVLISGVNTIPIPLVKLAQLAATHSTHEKICANQWRKHNTYSIS